MAATFLVVSDDHHKAYLNRELICMFRIKKDGKGNFTEPWDVEIEFVGGTKKRLVGDTAKHFVSTLDKGVVD
jgi:hypothetical protein